MIVIEYKDIELDYCVKCHGAWFDHGELELLLKSASLECSKLHFDTIDQPEAETAERKRKCPICNRKLRKSFVGPRGDILIDVCQKGHGLWFDGGEIRELVRQMATEQPGIGDTQSKVFSFMEDIFHAQGQSPETA
jgi:Zn-finger nucleic acid-binding protein